MAIKLLVKDHIRAEILKILSGYSFRERGRDPKIYIVIPWIRGEKVSLDIDKEVIDQDYLWFEHAWGIKSINLPYVLLLLKLDFGAEINIVTRPPTDGSYFQNERMGINNLLNFLDEIGCNVFLHRTFHSKLLLSNDLAILGSMNISKTALDPYYGGEELAVSIDDLSNLKMLESFAKELIENSKPFGYTFEADSWTRRYPCPIKAKVTRGWLYEGIVVDYFGEKFNREIRTRANCRIGDSFSEFLRIDLKEVAPFGDCSSYELAKTLSENLGHFYAQAIERYLQPSRLEFDRGTSYSLLYTTLGYRGKINLNEVAGFLEERFARRDMPQVQPILEKMDSTSD